MDKKEILKWVLISIVAGLVILLTFPVASLHCDKSKDICTITNKTLISGEQELAVFFISQIKTVNVRKHDDFYYPVVMDKRGEVYRLEAFPTKTQKGSEDIIQHILNDEKYDIEGSFFKIINKGY